MLAEHLILVEDEIGLGREGNLASAAEMQTLRPSHLINKRA